MAEQAERAFEDEPSTLASIESASKVAEILKNRWVDRAQLRNGIVLKLSPVPPLAIREAAILTPPPRVPMWISPDKEREEPNPNDPDYLAALDRYSAEQSFRVADTIHLLGTAIEHVPDGIDRPEDDGWIDRLDSLGIKVDRDNPHKRYLSWLRLYAYSSKVDISMVTALTTRLSGVTEEEVQRAAASFRRDA